MFELSVAQATQYYDQGEQNKQQKRRRTGGGHSGGGHSSSRRARSPPQHTWSQPFSETSSRESHVQPVPAPQPTMQSYSHHPYQQYYHQQHLSELYQHQPVYATPSSMDTLGDEPRRKKHKHEHSPEPPSSEAEQVTTIEDPLYLRQQIIDNSIALMHVLCPAAYGPHNQCHWTLVLLLRARNPDIWRAGIAADGLLVIEGPDGGVKAEALNLLFEAISAKLAKSVKRSWVRQGHSAAGDGDGGAEAETGLEEDGSTGARFASERREASR